MLKLLRRISYFINYHFLHKKKLQKIVEENLAGFSLKVYPSVFNPKAYYSSRIFADFINTLNLKDKSILDIGCGSGIVSVVAFSKGAVVTAVDKNPEAVKCTKENLENNMPHPLSPLSNELERVETLKPMVLQSDLFSAIEGEKFDYIFFNPPYYEKEPANNFELAFNAGKDLSVVKRFFEDAKFHLNENGKIYLIVSTDMDLELLNLIIEKKGYTQKTVKKHEKFFETFAVLEIE